MKRINFLFMFFIFIAQAYPQQIMEDHQKQHNSVEEMRMSALTSDPSKLNLKPDNEFQSIYGIVMEFHVYEPVISILVMKDGTVNLYASDQYGVKNGKWDVSKHTAEHFVRTALKYVDQGKIVKDFPYPESNEVYFYLLTYQGVRLISPSEKEQSLYEDLYEAGRNVFDEIGVLVEKAKKEKGKK